MWQDYLTRFHAWPRADKLTAIGIVVAIIAGIAIPLFIWFLSRKKETNGSIAESYERLLKDKDKELLDRLTRETEKRAVIEKELADIQQKLADPKEAVEKHKKVLDEAFAKLADFEKEFGKPRVTAAKKALAKGETKEAEKLFTEALEQGVKQPAEAAYQLGSLAEQKIEYEKAFEYYNRAVELEKNNPKYLNKAGIMAIDLGKYGEAEPLLRKALQIREKTLPPEQTDIAESLNNLAGLYVHQGRYAEAEPLYKRALAIGEKNLGQEHPAVATRLNNLAALYFNQGRYADAEPLYKRNISIMEKILPDHPDLAVMIDNYANCLRNLNRVPEAVELEARAKGIMERRGKKNNQQ